MQWYSSFNPFTNFIDKAQNTFKCRKIRGTAKRRDFTVLLSSVRYCFLVIRILLILYHQPIMKGGLHGYATNKNRHLFCGTLVHIPVNKALPQPELVATFCLPVRNSCSHLPSLEACQGLRGTTNWLRPKACHIAC